jgi:MFS family permease
MNRAEPAPSYRELLRIPGLTRILLGMAISRVGGSMLGVAVVLFALDLFESPAVAGAVTFASVAPGLFISPIVGALLDRHGRTRLIILDQLVGAGALLLIAALAVAGDLTPALMVAITAIAGLTAPLSNVGLRTLFPILVPKRLWERVNALDSNGYVLATLIGPPLAGLLFQVVGGAATMALIAALYGVSALVFIGTPDPRTEVASTGRLLVDAWQGLVYTLRNPTLRGLGVSLSVLNLAWGILTILLPVLLLTQLGVGPVVVGAVWAISGVTGGIGAFVAGRWRLFGRERAVLIWTMAGMTVCILLVLVSPTLPVIVIAMAVEGFLNGPMDVALFTLRQRRTDPAWMGRAFAVSMSLNFLGYPFGAAIGGALVATGTTVAIAAAAAISALAAVLSAVMLPRSRPEKPSVPPAPEPKVESAPEAVQP